MGEVASQTGMAKHQGDLNTRRKSARAPPFVAGHVHIQVLIHGSALCSRDSGQSSLRGDTTAQARTAASEQGPPLTARLFNDCRYVHVYATWAGPSPLGDAVEGRPGAHGSIGACAAIDGAQRRQHQPQDVRQQVVRQRLQLRGGGSDDVDRLYM